MYISSPFYHNHPIRAFVIKRWFYTTRPMSLQWSSITILYTQCKCTLHVLSSLHSPVNAHVSGASFAWHHISISLSLTAMSFMQKNLPWERSVRKKLQCSKFPQTLHERIWQQSWLTEILNKHTFWRCIAWKQFIIASISNRDGHFVHIRIYQLASKYFKDGCCFPPNVVVNSKQLRRWRTQSIMRSTSRKLPY